MAETKKSEGNVLWMLSTFLLIGILVGLGVSSVSGGSGQADVIDSDDQGTVQQPPQDYETPTIDDDSILGSADAPVTMIIFSDYECPYCQRFETATFPSIKTNFVDTGLVKVVFRDFPLSFHSKAHDASEAAECVGDELYWTMHDKISEKYDEWAEYTGDLHDLFATYASEIGASYDDVFACLNDETYYQEVEDDIADGRAAGVGGTPSFFVNGEFHVGALPYEDFADQTGNMMDGFETILNNAVAAAS